MKFIRWLLFPSSHRGVLVPGGFGIRGTEGKMLAINWARKQNKPYLGKTNVNLQSRVFIVLANQMMTIHRRALSAEGLLIGSVWNLDIHFLE